MRNVHLEFSDRLLTIIKKVRSKRKIRIVTAGLFDERCEFTSRNLIVVLASCSYLSAYCL